MAYHYIGAGTACSLTALYIALSAHLSPYVYVYWRRRRRRASSIVYYIYDRQIICNTTVAATQAQWRRRSVTSAYYIDDLQMYTCVRHHCEYRRCRHCGCVHICI